MWSHGFIFDGGRFRRKIEEQFFVGSSVSVVAYVVSPLVARYLLEFADQSLATIDPRQWYAFDGYVWQFLDERGIPTFIPFRNYGEHGGWMSPGHRQEGRKLLPHRAECLMGPLYFLPFYARGRTGRFLVVRFLHKLKHPQNSFAVKRSPLRHFVNLVRTGKGPTRGDRLEAVAKSVLNGPKRSIDVA